MILDIITYPNKLLRTKSKAVLDFDSTLHTTLDSMYETMINKGGVGLAAIQVGIPKRMLIINLPREDKLLHKEDLLEIINPEILSAEGEILFQEGCLSVPNFYEMVGRFSYIKLKYFDRFGKEWILEAEDYLAVAIQHEIDHLNGVLFVDKLSILKRKKFEKEYKRLQKEAKEAQKIAQREAKMEKVAESRLDSAKNALDSAIHTEKMSDSALDSANRTKITESTKKSPKNKPERLYG